MAHNLLTLAGALGFAYVSFLIGTELLSTLRVQFTSPLKRCAYAVLLGYAAFGIGGFLLASFGLFRAPYLWGLVAVFLVAARGRTALHLQMLLGRERRSAWLARISAWFQENRLLKILIVTWLVINSALVFVPLTGHDTLDYHFPIMRDIAETGSLTFTGAISIYQFLPVLAEIIYTVPLALFNEAAAPFVFQLIQYSGLVLLAVLVYEFIRERVRYSFLAPVAVLMLLSLMDLQREVMHGGYIDVPVLLFGMASTLLLIENVTSGAPARPELMLSAVLLGVAVSMKYSGLMFVVVNAIFFFTALKKFPRAAFLKTGGLYALTVLLVGGFWYLKNTLIFGSPVYPMFSGTAFTGEVQAFLLPRTFLNFFAFPFFTFGQWFVSDRESSSRLIPLAYFAALYLSLAFLAVRREKIQRAAWLLFGFTELFLLFLFFTSHQIRFLLPPVVALAPLLALLGDNIVDVVVRTKSEVQRHTYLRVVKSISVAAFLTVFIGNFHYFAVKFTYLTGSYTEAEYIEEIGGQ